MRSNVSFFYLLILPSLFNFSFGCLTTTFYDNICPQALPTIKRVVEAAIKKEPRMGASLLRLHFHDCFVNGCDASVLLDDTSTFQGEKQSAANNNSARGFEVIDEIKSEVDKACCGSVVSCADILAVAARDSVVSLGGPTWRVQLGRRDSTTANRSAANEFLPPPFFNLSDLVDNFKRHNLNVRDLVALSGAHTIGFAQCVSFRNHTYNDTNIDPEFAALRKQSCPSSGGDTNLAPLDSSPENFDDGYFRGLVGKKGLLHSDQELFNGGPTDAIVKSYVSDPKLFARDFAQSMIRMANIGVVTGRKGQIRVNCRRVN